MIKKLHRYVLKRRMAKLLAPFDREIAEARAKHRPIKHIEERKVAFVRRALAGEGR